MKQEEFEWGLYQLRQGLMEANEKGLLPKNWIPKKEKLLRESKKREKDLVKMFEKKHPECFELEGEITLYSESFGEDIKKMVTDGKEGFLFGSYGFTLYIKEEHGNFLWRQIPGFSSHIHDFYILEDRLLVVGEWGEVKILGKHQGEWTYTHLSVDQDASFYHILMPFPQHFLLIGDQGRVFYMKKTGKGLETIDDWESDKRWKAGVEVPGGVLIFGQEGYMAHIHCTLEGMKVVDESKISHETIYMSKNVGNEVLLGGSNGLTMFLKEEDGWTGKEPIPGFTSTIYEALVLDEDNILVVGAKKQCSHLQRKEGRWTYQKTLEGFPTYISAIVFWGENKVLLGGWNGKLATLDLSLPKSHEEKMKRVVAFLDNRL